MPYWISIGPVELLLVVIAVTATVALRYQRSKMWKWTAAVAASLAVSTAITPPDPLSTLIFTAILLAFFVAGVKLRPALAASRT